jgi:hypothetical protein
MAASGKSIVVPFWIASEHFMVGWGRLETLPPALLFVDTGLAGAGVKLAESVIKQGVPKRALVQTLDAWCGWG